VAILAAESVYRWDRAFAGRSNLHCIFVTTRPPFEVVVDLVVGVYWEQGGLDYVVSQRTREDHLKRGRGATLDLVHRRPQNLTTDEAEVSLVRAGRGRSAVVEEDRAKAYDRFAWRVLGAICCPEWLHYALAWTSEIAGEWAHEADPSGGVPTHRGPFDAQIVRSYSRAKGWGTEVEICDPRPVGPGLSDEFFDRDEGRT
jgi:hypothetical protein